MKVRKSLEGWSC